MPTPEVYESLSRGTIDGVVFPFNSLAPYEIHKLSKTGTIGENFGTFVANWVISEKRFQSLPPAVQQDLTAMGEQLTKAACTQVEKDEAGDIEKVKAAGVKLTPLSGRRPRHGRDGHAGRRQGLGRHARQARQVGHRGAECVQGGAEVGAGMR